MDEVRNEVRKQIGEKAATENITLTTADGKQAQVSVEDVVALLFLRRAHTLQGILQDKADQEKNKLDAIDAARQMGARVTELTQEADRWKNSNMPKDMQDYFEAHGIAFDETVGKSDDNLKNTDGTVNPLRGEYTFTKDQWGVASAGLNAQVDKMTSDNSIFTIKMKSTLSKADNALEAYDGINKKHNDTQGSIIRNIAG
ncbi:MAG: hypothetical protein ACR2P9_01295 [Gammaproteobacteria bacterium]